MISLGTQLDRYIIESHLGSGGMGDVYLATDTRLERSVAIKVLRATSIGTDAAARFEREAKAIASLNHPNICAIHDVGHTADHDFLVMERLVGQSLEQRLLKGPFDIDALLEHGASLADALAAAHAQGLVHRDLKPSNVFVTDHGPMKLLDFGLVKNLGTSDATTRAADGFATSDGVVPGTIAYMSPEQLKGERIDARTDVFSLGLILYEMATGRRAFTGATPHLLAAAILDQTPANPCQIRIDLPENLQHVILKAIEKDRHLRYQSAAELRADLKRLQRDRHVVTPATPLRTPDGSTASDRTNTSSDAAIVLGVLQRHRRVAVATLLAGALLVTGIVVVIQKFRPGQSATGQSMLSADIQPLTFSGDIRYPAISPDGRFIAFVRQRAIWIRQLSEQGAQKDVQIVLPPDAGTYRHVTFTADGNALDFVANAQTGHPTLMRVSLLGGTPSLIARDVWSAPGWAPDAQHIAFLRSAGLVQDSTVVVADPDGSHERPLATRRPPSIFFNASIPGGQNYRPSWSPDGHLIAVTGSDGQTAEIELLDAVNGNVVRTVRLRESFLGQTEWLDPTRLLTEVLSGKNAGLSLLDLRTEKWTPVTHDLATLQNFVLTGGKNVAVATRTERKVGLWLADGHGENVHTLFDVNASQSAAPQVDDTGAVWYMSGATGDVYRIAADSTESSLIFSHSDGYGITSDGATVVLATTDNALVRMRVDGSNRITLVNRDATSPALLTASRTVFYLPAGPTNGVFAVSLDGGKPERISEKTTLSRPYVSPQGDHVAFVTDKNVVTVCDLPRCEHPIALDIPIGNLTRGGNWTADGRSLAYSPDDDRSNVWARPITGGAPFQVTHFEKSALPIWEFAWSPNGEHLVLARGRYFDDIVLIKGLR